MIAWNSSDGPSFGVALQAVVLRCSRDKLMLLHKV